MRTLLVKLSSLGDVVHTLPAITDAMHALPAIRFDWAIEPAFAALAHAHPAVERVIETPLRRWRRTPWAVRGEYRRWREAVRGVPYDLVLDAQGLIKSAAVALVARGKRRGFDVASAREPLASLCYDERLRVDRQQHAIERVRQLFAGAFGYPCPRSDPDFGLRLPIRPSAAPAHYSVLLPGTTWPSKAWPLSHWRALCGGLTQRGETVFVAHGDATERAQAEAIVSGNGSASLLPPQSLDALLGWLGHASTVVAVDTGLGHLASALGTRSLLLYGPTSALLTGARGRRALDLSVDFACAPCRKRLCGRVSEGPSPCFATLTAAQVLAAIDAHPQ